MVYKPVGADEAGKFPPRVETNIAATIGDLTGVAVDDIFGALDMRLEQAVTVGIAGDSTGDAADEGLETAFREVAPVLWPERPSQVLRWDRVADAYPGAFETWNAPAATVETVIASDTFTRTAASVKGTSPDLGAGVYVASSENYAVADGKASIITPGTYAPQGFQLATRDGAEGKWSADVWVAMNGGTGTDTRFFGPTRSLVGDSIYIRIQGAATSAVTLDRKIGATTTTLATFPAGTIPNGSAQAMYPVSIDLTGLTVTATVGANTVTATILASDVTALTGLSYVGFGSSNPGFAIDNILVSVTTAVVNPPALSVYNASVWNSIADYHQGRIATAYPVRPDMLIVNYGHNYLIADDVDGFLTKVRSFIDAFHVVYPDVPVVAMSQNPRFLPASRVEMQGRRMASLRAYCARNGWGYIPGYEVFAARTDGGKSLLNADGVHPLPATADVNNVTGSRLQAETIKKWLQARSARPQA